MQPAVTWHDDKIHIITTFQAFVKHRHVKANQKTYTQRKKTFDKHKIHTHKHISQGSSSSLLFLPKNGELCFMTTEQLYSFNLKKCLIILSFSILTPQQPLASTPKRKQTASNSTRYCAFFISLCTPRSGNKRFHTTKDEHEYSYIFHETTTT